MSAVDLNTLILDGSDAARAKKLADLDKQIALVELFDARFRELCAAQIDGSDESIEVAFRQAHLDVFGRDVKAERWTFRGAELVAEDA